MTHNSTHIDKCIAYHQNVFVLVNKCSSHLRVLYSFFYYVCHQCVTHTHTHTHHIRVGIRSSVRHIISYGVSIRADATTI